MVRGVMVEPAEWVERARMEAQRPMARADKVVQALRVVLLPR